MIRPSRRTSARRDRGDGAQDQHHQIVGELTDHALDAVEVEAAQRGPGSQGRAPHAAGGGEFRVGRLIGVAVGGWFGAANRASAPLRRFNGLSQEAAAGLLRSCWNVDRWVQRIVDGRPYPTWNDLLNAARDAAHPLTSAELEAALAHRQIPPLMPPGRRGDTPTEARLRDQLATGAHSYEERFGRQFLVQTTGRSPEELLVQLASSRSASCRSSWASTLVCHLNLARIGALIESAAPKVLDVRLDPREDRCCVALSTRPIAGQDGTS